MLVYLYKYLYNDILTVIFVKKCHNFLKSHTLDHKIDLFKILYTVLPYIFLENTEKTTFYTKF